MNDNFAALAAALPLTRAHARQPALNSFQAAFLPAPARAAFVAQVEDFFNQ